MRRATIALLLLLGACSDGVALDGPWRLVETDIAEDRTLCRDMGDICVGDQLPGPMVYGAGWDKSYVVLVRHPTNDSGGVDYVRSEYFYVVRTAGEAEPTWRAQVHGPFTEQQFKRETERLRLPPLTVWPDSW